MRHSPLRLRWHLFRRGPVLARSTQEAGHSRQVGDARSQRSPRSRTESLVLDALPGSALSCPPSARALPRSIQLRLEAARPPEQFEHEPGARQVDSLRRQRGDLPEPLDITGAVAAGAAGASDGIEQAFPFIGAKRLRVKSAQFRGHGDAEQLVGLPRPRWAGAWERREPPMLMRTDPFRDLDRLTAAVRDDGASGRNADGCVPQG
jgi:hypothetical protein